MGLKVLTMREFLVSHILLVGGLVLLSVGLASDTVGLNIAGIWVVTVGFCLAFGSVFKKLAAK